MQGPEEKIEELTSHLTAAQARLVELEATCENLRETVCTDADKILTLEAREARLREALEDMRQSIPACDGLGGLYTVHFDGEGNEIGTENVDPVGVVGMLAGKIDAALADGKEGTK